MIERKRPPSHPGGILKRQYLEPLGLTVTFVAAALRVSRKTLSEIVNERAPVTEEMALRLSKAFRTTPELWVNLQHNYTLWQTAHRTHAWEKVRVISRELASI